MPCRELVRRPDYAGGVTNSDLAMQLQANVSSYSEYSSGGLTPDRRFQRG